MPSLLMALAALAVIVLAGAFFYDLAQSAWGDRHPRLRELAMLFAFVAGVGMVAGMMILPGPLVWAVITSAPMPDPELFG